MSTAALDEAVDAVERSCGAVAVVVLRRGEVVVERAAGRTADGRDFTSRTPVFLFSAVKPVAALCVLVAAADGALDLDEPVAVSWAGFGAHGKDRVTIATALAHGAGVPGWRDPVTIADLADRGAAADALAAARPWWPPGEPGEHAVSYGHLLDGILGHATGRDITAWWPRAVEACGATIDLVPGTGDRRPAPLEDPGGAWRDGWMRAIGPMADLLANPAALLDVDVVNHGPVRSLVAPAVTGYASAHDLARLHAWWASPDAAARLGPDLHRRMRSPSLVGHDHVLDRHVAWGLGQQFEADGSFGMGGVGGCAGWWVPDVDLAVGITTPVTGPLDRLDPIDDAVAAIAAGASG